MIRQFLTFTLNDTVYAAEVSQVLEVLDYKKPQELPCPDPEVAGIIRSRNKNVSVINLRKKFGFAEQDPTSQTRIIVFEIPDDEFGVTNYFGAIVDSVLEVLEIENTALDTPPEIGNTVASRFITGIGQKDNKYIIILDFSKVFTFEELSSITTLAEDTSESKE
ncbi:MAG: chemotaxis protein CheW [Treponema sp.]|nr:chemotaxis protein CheW [Treponema sp.]